MQTEIKLLMEEMHKADRINESRTILTEFKSMEDYMKDVDDILANQNSAKHAGPDKTTYTPQHAGNDNTKKFTPNKGLSDLVNKTKGTYDPSGSTASKEQSPQSEKSANTTADGEDLSKLNFDPTDQAISQKSDDTNSTGNASADNGLPNDFKLIGADKNGNVHVADNTGTNSTGTQANNQAGTNNQGQNTQQQQNTPKPNSDASLDDLRKQYYNFNSKEVNGDTAILKRAYIISQAFDKLGFNNLAQRSYLLKEGAIGDAIKNGVTKLKNGAAQLMSSTNPKAGSFMVDFVNSMGWEGMNKNNPFLIMVNQALGKSITNQDQFKHLYNAVIAANKSGNAHLTDAYAKSQKANDIFNNKYFYNLDREYAKDIIICDSALYNNNNSEIKDSDTLHEKLVDAMRKNDLYNILSEPPFSNIIDVKDSAENINKRNIKNNSKEEDPYKLSAIEKRFKNMPKDVQSELVDLLTSYLNNNGTN